MGSANFSRHVELSDAPSARAIWQLVPVAGQARRFLLKNTETHEYLYSYVGSVRDAPGKVTILPWSDDASELQWLLFPSDELQFWGERCKFTIMHSQSLLWLDHSEGVKTTSTVDHVDYWVFFRAD